MGEVFEGVVLGEGGGELGLAHEGVLVFAEQLGTVLDYGVVVAVVEDLGVGGWGEQFWLGLAHFAN